jgi:beta-N-acetylhexosaminidase
VIGTRAFGDDAELVARHVAAYVRGLQSRRVAACAKHFPGHGSTTQDSHLELPTLVGDVEDGLPPFRAAIAAGVASIMTAHVRVGALPATVDPAVLGDLLRGELGFDGVVFADALEMNAVSETIGVVETAVRAVEAGADALCVGHDLGEEAVAAIVDALASRVSEGRLRDAAGRVRRLGDWARPEAGSPARDEAAVAALRAVHVAGDVALGEAPVVVELRPPANIAAGEAEHVFAGAVVVREGDPVPDADVYVVRDAHRHAWMRDAADRPEAVVVETGLPVWRPARSRGYVATHGGGGASLHAAEEVLGL